jgi:hypothetical protein
LGAFVSVEDNDKVLMTTLLESLKQAHTRTFRKSQSVFHLARQRRYHTHLFQAIVIDELACMEFANSLKILGGVGRKLGGRSFPELIMTVKRI